MKEIVLNGKYGKTTLVDDKDFDWLNQWKWTCTKNKLVRRIEYVKGSGRKNPKYKRFFMHRLIVNTPKEMETDHRNGNSLDNRKSNLRICTHQQNMMNQKKQNQKNKTSKYKGVSWAFCRTDKKGKWKARIGYKGKTTSLGVYKNEHYSALMYDFWAIELFGEFAQTNFKVIAHS